MTRCLTVALLSLLLASPRPSAADVPDWAAVSAIFVERCVMCHSAMGAAQDLRLDSYQAAVAGGARGVVLTPGDPAGSELIRRVRGESAPRMPVLGSPLPPEQIDLIVRWVAAGLPETNGAPAGTLPASAGGGARDPAP
jgi:mono/diheme cytochrome c family protein